MKVSSIICLALIVIMVAFAGCGTFVRKYSYDDLLARSNAERFEPTFPVPKTVERTIEPLPRECFIGKWTMNSETYIEEYVTDYLNKMKKYHSDTELVDTYDFKNDGTYTLTFLNNGKPMIAHGSWIYANGLLTIIAGEKKVHRKYRVDWFEKDKMAIRWRSDELGAEFWKGVAHGFQEFRNQQEWASYHTDEYGCEWYETRRIGDNGARIIKRVKSPAYYNRVIEVNDSHTGKPLYSILKCERDSQDSFSYRFTLEFAGDKHGSLDNIRTIKDEFRRYMRDGYLASTPNVDARSLHVAFPEFRLEDGRIEGTAAILSLSVVSFRYDDTTRSGVIAVRTGAEKYEEAREYVRANIEAVVRDKNIALETGKLPPKATFYIGKEEMKDGNVLEIEFVTE